MIAAGQIPVKIIRKKIKNIYLRVQKDGMVTVSAPFYVSEEQIQSLLDEKKEWLEGQRQRIAERLAEQPADYLSGETVRVWGQHCRLEVLLSAQKNSVCQKENVLQIKAKSGSTSWQREKLLTEWYREEMKKRIPALLAKWQPVMGVYAGSWSIRDMKSRWGSCNIRTGRICLNLQLAKYPEECLEYVVVHELTHLLEKGHGTRFKAYLDQYLPGWREVEKYLKI